MARNHDVIVLGAGIVGTSTAIHLQQAGKRVALVDRRGAGEETSYGNSGAIEASSILPYAFPKLAQITNIIRDRDSSARTDLKHLDKVLPFVLRLRRETTIARREMSARALRPLLERVVAEHKALMGPADALRYLREQGWLRIYKTQKAYDDDEVTRRYAREFGIAFDTLTPQDMTAVEPHLKPAYASALLMKGTATVTSPGNVTKAYAALFTRDGGAFYMGDGKSLRQDERYFGRHLSSLDRLVRWWAIFWISLLPKVA